MHIIYICITWMYINSTNEAHTHTDPAQRPLLPKLGIAPVVTIHESNFATSNPEKVNSPDFFKPKFNKFVTAKKEV